MTHSVPPRHHQPRDQRKDDHGRLHPNKDMGWELSYLSRVASPADDLLKDEHVGEGRFHRRLYRY